MVEVKKEWICRTCKAIVPREKRFEHMKKNHNPAEYFDYVEVVRDEWEK